MKTLMILVVVLIVFGGGWWFISQKDSSNYQNPTTSNSADNGSVSQSTNVQSSSTSNTSSNTSTAPATGSVKSFTITGSPYKFLPNTISVNKGDTVKITFVNSQGNHDLVIDEFNVKTKIIPAGQSETVTFVANKTGSFQYYCSVGTHRQLGMWGTLTVK